MYIIYSLKHNPGLVSPGFRGTGLGTLCVVRLRLDVVDVVHDCTSLMKL